MTEPAAAPAVPTVPARAYLPTLNVGVSWANSFVAAAGAFVVTPALLHSMGEHAHGVWLLIMSFIDDLRILDLGLTAGCMRFTAAALPSGDPRDVRRVFHTSSAIFAVLGLVALAGAMGMTFLLPRVYPALLGDMHAVIAALGAGVAVDFAFRPYAASLRGRSLFFVYDGVEIVTYAIFKLALVLYLSRLGISIQWLCLVVLGETLARDAATFVLALRYCRWTSIPDPRQVHRPLLRQLLAFSGATFAMAISDLLRGQFQTAAIGFAVDRPGESLTTYGIGLRLVVLASSSIGVIWAVVIPRFSELAVSGEREANVELLRRTALRTGVLAAFGMVSIGVFAGAFFRVWIGRPWVEESYLLALIVLPGYFAYTVQGPCIGLLSGIGRLRELTAMTIAEMVCNVGLTSLLIRPLGLVGACLGLSISLVTFRGLVFPYVMRRAAGIPIRDSYRMHARTIGIAATYLVAIVGLGSVRYAGWLQLGLGCSAATAIFLVVVGLWLPEARAAALARLRRLRG